MYSMNVFESIMTGLNEAVEYEKGNLTEKTTLTVELLPEITAVEIKSIRNEIALSQTILPLDNHT